MRHRRVCAPWLCALTLFAGGVAGADEARPALRGGWVATAGAGTGTGAGALRGRWTAEPLAGDPNTVQGTWTLVDARDETVGGGTWSGRQQGRRWRGAWSARTQDGRLYAGGWEADTPGRAGQSFAEMLTASTARQITGSWRMGGARGRWWLKG